MKIYMRRVTEEEKEYEEKLDEKQNQNEDRGDGVRRSDLGKEFQRQK